MSELQLEQVVDITQTTLENYGKRGAFTDLTGDIQSYWAWNNLFNKDYETVTGYVVTRRVLTETQPNARETALFSNDETEIVDGVEKITMYFRHLETSFMFDLREEEAQGGPEAIIKVTKLRRYGAMMDAIKLFEDRWWGTVPTSDDGKRLLGFPYWAQYDATVTASTVALTGDSYSYPWSGTYPGGLNHPRYRNHAGVYSAVTPGDLVKQMRRMWLKMQYTSPIPHPSYDQGKSQYMIAMCSETLLSLEDLAKAQNDKLGNDIDRMGGETVFRGRPLRFVPQYDQIDTYSGSSGNFPVDFIDWSKLYLIGRSGWQAKEMVIPRYKGQHNTVGVTFDWTLTSMCHDRRYLGRLIKV